MEEFAIKKAAPNPAPPKNLNLPFKEESLNSFKFADLIHDINNKFLVRTCTIAPELL